MRSGAGRHIADLRLVRQEGEPTAITEMGGHKIRAVQDAVGLNCQDCRGDEGFANAGSHLAAVRGHRRFGFCVGQTSSLDRQGSVRQSECSGHTRKPVLIMETVEQRLDARLLRLGR
nr:hypothetical protein [Jannaschia pohangensis]